MILLVAVPAAGHNFLAANRKPCFTVGAKSYQLSSNAAADIKVKIDNVTPHPDLRMQLVDNPDAADFVLVDDFAGAGTNAKSCKGAAVKTIRVDSTMHSADVTVNLSNRHADHKIHADFKTQADFKIYVQSADFSPRDAAALFAVMWHAGQNRTLAERR